MTRLAFCCSGIRGHSVTGDEECGSIRVSMTSIMQFNWKVFAFPLQWHYLKHYFPNQEGHYSTMQPIYLIYFSLFLLNKTFSNLKMSLLTPPWHLILPLFFWEIPVCSAPIWYSSFGLSVLNIVPYDHMPCKVLGPCLISAEYSMTAKNHFILKLVLDT